MKQFYFILVSAFIMGVVSGVYIFFASRADAPDFTPFDTEVRGFEITGDEYGGCERLGCPSFRIIDTGAYIYLRSVRGGEDVRHENTLSDTELKNIKDELRKTSLAEIESRSQSASCAPLTDGVAYKYRISIGDVEYVVDSCVDEVRSSTLFNILKGYFEEPK